MKGYEWLEVYRDDTIQHWQNIEVMDKTFFSELSKGK